MCGIAGIVDAGAAVSPAHLAAMGDAIAHRGPDGAGAWADGGIGLAHRRLAIIDPAGGAQPMRSPDGAWTISFNGEIYNHAALRAELAAGGRVFSTRSDTEVVLAAFERWGADAPARLRGMFAVAAAHPASRRVVLARDHLGIKPLLWMRAGGRIAFASELRALRRLPWFDPAIDLAAIDQFLRLQYVPAPATAYRAVRKLEPGCLLEIDAGTGAVAQRRYWRPSWGAHRAGSLDAWAERIEAAVAESVDAHLAADVPYGVFLSGGMDSSLVAACVARRVGRSLTAFCIGFEEEGFDERAWAGRVAARIGVELRTETVRCDALGILPRLLDHYGEPFGDPSAIPTWHVARLARSAAKMVLSGDGGDELFAGYTSYASWARVQWGLGRPWAKRLLRPLLARLAPRRYPPPPSPSAASWLDAMAVTDAACRARLWRPELRPAAADPAVAARLDGLHPLDLAQAVDLETYLPNDILAKVDIASMYHGLEVRTPLADIRVLEAAAAVPPALRQACGPDGRIRGKMPLARVAGRLVGPGLFERPKQGFAVPVERWLRPGGAMDPGLRERLTERSGPLAELLRPEEVARVCAHGDAHAAWLLVVLDAWLRGLRG